MQICPGELAGNHFGQIVSGSPILRGARLPHSPHTVVFKGTVLSGATIRKKLGGTLKNQCLIEQFCVRRNYEGNCSTVRR